MSRIQRIAMTAAAVMAITAAVNAQENLGRIYGKVTITGGEELEGRISWAGHETNWYNTFDASYDFYDQNREAYWRQREYLGRRPGDVTAQFIVYFGDIAVIDQKGSRAIITLKDGREYEVFDGDVGETVVVSDVEMGTVKVSWRNLDSVEFMDEPASYAQQADENAYPIYGKVLTQSDHVFEGYIIWDNDETLSTDVLDAKEGRSDRTIPFSKIQSIAPRTRRSSDVVLTSGREIILSGSNDVDSGNRGLFIADQNIGIVAVEWRAVERVDFDHTVPAVTYSDFTPGSPLYGIVVDADGEEHEGFIRWDDDEAMTTDFLNGEAHGYEIKAVLSNIKEIRRRTRKSALVILKNGEELLMRGSNDVNEDNKGIVVLERPDDREGLFFEWNDFEKVIFRQ